MKVRERVVAVGAVVAGVLVVVTLLYMALAAAVQVRAWWP